MVTIFNDSDFSQTLPTIITQDLVGLRLDQAASYLYPNFSRTSIQRFIEEGKLFLNGLPAKKRLVVALGDQLSFKEESKVQALATLSPIKMDFSVLYEDEDLFVINKPPGLVVHPGAGNRGETFIHGLLHHMPHIASEGFDSDRFGLVHRLDKDTSGVLISAKNRLALWKVSRQFQERKVYKEYRALVWGLIPFEKREVITHIARSERDRTRMMVVDSSKGKEAISVIHRVAHLSDASVVMIDLKTGRTHQIRVHLEHLGYPIIGDSVYSSALCKNRSQGFATRQMLHCHRIIISHPTTGKKCEFIADLPSDMIECHERL